MNPAGCNNLPSAPTAGNCENGFRTLAPISIEGKVINNQFITVFILSGIVLLIVFGLLTVILLRYRHRGQEGEPAQTAGNRKIEATWIGIPVLMLTALAIYSGFTMSSVNQSFKDPIQINVIGHQWWWEFQYPSYGIDTAGDIHLPTNTPIVLNITSGDVIHSFWVPALGWKRDAIPAKINDMHLKLTQTGDYVGFCSEYCGTEHAWMMIRVVSQSKSDFDAWVANERNGPPPPSTALAKQGQQIFESNTCVTCHVLSRVGPNLTDFGQRGWIGSGVLVNNPENLARWINNAQQIKPGTRMPSFHFSPDQLNALVAYLEGLK